VTGVQTCALPIFSRNILYNVLGQALAIGLGFVAARVVFRQLGDDALGIIYFTLTLSTVLFAILEMGICSTAVREVAAHVGDDPGYVCDLARTAGLFYWSACVLLAVGVYWGAPVLVERWIHLRAMDASTATRMVRILGVGGLTVLPRSLYGSFLRGVERMEFPNAIDVSVATLQQSGTILILALGRSVFSVAYWISACAVLGTLAYAAISARFLSTRALVPGYAPGVVRRNAGFSAKMMSISVLSLIHTQTDKVVLSALLPIGALGYYSVLYGLSTRVSGLADAVGQAVFPSFSALLSGGDRERVMRQYWTSQDLVCLGTAPLFGAIAFLAPQVLRFVFTGAIGRMLALPIILLSLGFYLHGTLVVPYYFSLSAGKPEISVKVNLVALFATVPATVALVSALGVIGAAASWVVYHVFVYSYGVPRICSECLRIPVLEWYGHVGKILALAGLVYGLAWGLLVHPAADSLLAATLAYVSATLALSLGAYGLMRDELRAAVARSLRVIRMKTAESA